jgi:hypothetical protein
MSHGEAVSEGNKRGDMFPKDTFPQVTATLLSVNENSLYSMRSFSRLREKLICGWRVP